MNQNTWCTRLFRIFTGTALTLAVALPAIRPAAAQEADDANQKVIEYYRRKANLPPAIEAKVTGIKDSAIPGAKSAVIQMKRGAQTQTVPILMSPDGRFVVFGEVEDVTSDPFAAIAAKISIKGSPVRGAADAPVTIVEFSDFQCPYCSRAHKTVVTEVMPAYEGKVRLVYKNFPLGFHKWAEPAGIAGACAFEQEPDSFWNLYDYYFEHQREMTPENIQEKSLEALEGTKVDKEKWTTCYTDKATVSKIRTDMAEGKEVGVTGTPAFIINGRKISGAQPFTAFKAIIDDELARSSGGAS